MSTRLVRAAHRTLALAAVAVLAGGTSAIAAPTGHRAHLGRCSHGKHHHHVSGCQASAHVGRPRQARPTTMTRLTPTVVSRPTSAPAAAPPAATSAPAAAAPVASTAPCANTTVMPTTTNLATVQAATLCLLNQIRGQHGLGALTLNADLQQSATFHNNDQVTANYFAHVGPAGDTPLSRIEATGYLADGSVSRVIGENIAWGSLNDATPSAIVTAWVNSPEHLANILDGSYTDTGLAVLPEAPASVSAGQPSAIYTEDFGGVVSSGS